jgi:very-short-patch-repair endonuclease
MSMNFGPLNREGGERRLNVAVTRARYHVHLLSSIRSHDIDLTRTSKVGPKRLKEYLKYAEQGPQSLFVDTTNQNNQTESPFEQHVMQELQLHGLEVRPQIGCSGYRIDLALVDPEQSDSFVIGIECDGATYHRSATARDRDRLRQEILEGLGWKIIRIWSTDWMRDPKQQVKRVMKFYNENLLKIRNGTDQALHSPPPIESPTPVGIQPTKVLTQYGNYGEIQDVPAAVIDQCIKEQYNFNGQMSKKELTVSVARQLGFKRVGSKILRRVGKQIEVIVRKGEIKLSEEN